MNPVKEIEYFLTSVEWTDAKRKRIQSIIDSIPPKVITKRVVKTNTIKKKIIVFTDNEIMGRLDILARSICRKHRVPIAAFRGPIRRRRLVEARELFYQKAKDQLKATLKEIGSYVNRDHSTICQSLNKNKNHD